MRLRLYHHHDGARVAYREAGAGPVIALLHSAYLSHKEFEPVVEHLADRFRVVLPDLPLHGDSEHRAHHPYTLDWMAEVMSGFSAEALGPRPLIGGHGMGAEILVQAVISGRLRPPRIVLLPNRMHRRPERPWMRSGLRAAAWPARLPVIDRALSHLARAAFRPDLLAGRLSARGTSTARDLVRHAFADVGGNAELARSWSRFARAWPRGAQSHLLDAYPRIDGDVLLLWADEDEWHPVDSAEEALDLLPHAELRVLSGAGFLLAHDDPVGLARELAAFSVRGVRPAPGRLS
ncbi:MAG: alpha/beta hydrolase [Actinobacteria bacterium]|nr:MAG: alpha/beta hydrolase [Actinomycetota bacterium]